jgi:hypothetical protein
MKAIVAALVLSALAAAIGAASFAADPVRVAHGWLAIAFAGWVTGVGSALVLMLATVSRAVWIVPLRRAFEAIAMTVPGSSLLLVPPLLARPGLHPAEPLPGWLRTPGLELRAALCLVAAIVSIEVFLSASRAQDRHAESRVDTARAASAVGILVLGAATSLASFDWIGGLHADWVSSALGLQVLTGGVLSALGTATLLVLAMRARGWPDVVRAPHLHALGTALFVAACVWGYLQFAPFLVVWMGDRPVTVTFYGPRIFGAWTGVAVTLVLTRFALPFAALLGRRAKRHPWVLGGVATMLALSGPLELLWWVVPSARPFRFDLVLSDLAAAISVIALGVAIARIRLRGHPVLPEGDAARSAALAYRGE